jgi:HSP20 family protein
MMAEQKQSPEQQQESRQSSRSLSRSPESRGMSRYDPFDFMDQPFGLLRRFTDDLDRLFGSPFGLTETSGRGRGWQPSLDVFRRDNDLVVRADLPGLTKDDVNVEITDEAIVIEGERQEEREEKERSDIYVRERRYGRFLRTIPLPEDVDVQRARANFRNGTLEVVVPLTERARAKRSRRIEIGEGETQPAAARAAGAGGTR